MCMFLVYYAYNGRWAVFGTSILSFAFILYLIGLKAYLERHLPKGTAQSVVELENDSSSSASLPLLRNPV